jgi:ATP-dependent Clp protease adaptor protein ClpS
MGTTFALPEIDEEILGGDETSSELDRLYHVILLDDDDHTVPYVVDMLMKIFGFSEEKAYFHTVEVDTTGHTRLLTCGLQEAERKRDLIHGEGRDFRLPRCLGSMAALIEPAER